MFIHQNAPRRPGALSLFLGASFLACGLAAPQPALSASPALKDVIIVTGARRESSTELLVAPDAGPLLGGDPTFLTARVPGGARIANGALSGQMQYRGLFGERLNLRVDGQRFASGGPNLMDPVFHYAPAPLIASVSVDRGISPVSQGPGLAGGADAVFKRIDYADADSIVFGYDLAFGARSVNDSIATGGVVGAASDEWRFNLLGSWEEGDDSEFADGVIAGTAFERGVYGGSAGVKTGVGEFSIDARRQETGPSGNPPFPMDIQYFDTDFVRLSYDHEIGAVRTELAAFYTDVSHLMDNFSIKPAPPAMRQRATFADATTWGATAKVMVDLWGGELRLGMDGEMVDHHVRITNPNNESFFVTAFPDIETDRVGGFAEWAGALGPVQSEIGIRIDFHDHQAGEAQLGAALPMAPRGLAAAFNAADRSVDDTTIDAALRFWTPARGGVSWRLTLAHKQKTPGYIQRFGWLPIGASGGLADGNIYVGDLGLKPESAYIVEGGFDYSDARAYVRPTVYWRRIDDYIQGVPFDNTVGVADTPVEMIASMSGDATPLRWANVDARLIGVDLDGGYDLPGPLRLDGVISYVRGDRRDVDDQLYRIAPASLIAGLTWEGRGWSATFETRAVADQSRVSLVNEEAETDGYVVLSLYGDWEIAQGWRIAAGIENLTDEVYRDHLSGYNRNGFGDAGLGERLPGEGRGVFIRLDAMR